jgi:hypothetical protein
MIEPDLSVIVPELLKFEKAFEQTAPGVWAEATASHSSNVANGPPPSAGLSPPREGTVNLTLKGFFGSGITLCFSSPILG